LGLKNVFASWLDHVPLERVFSSWEEEVTDHVFSGQEEEMVTRMQRTDLALVMMTFSCVAVEEEKARGKAFPSLVEIRTDVISSGLVMGVAFWVVMIPTFVSSFVMEEEVREKKSSFVSSLAGVIQKAYVEEKMTPFSVFVLEMWTAWVSVLVAGKEMQTFVVYEAEVTLTTKESACVVETCYQLVSYDVAVVKARQTASFYEGETGEVCVED
jgi:hypothetical protein